MTHKMMKMSQTIKRLFMVWVIVFAQTAGRQLICPSQQLPDELHFTVGFYKCWHLSFTAWNIRGWTSGYPRETMRMTTLFDGKCICAKVFFRLTCRTSRTEQTITIRFGRLVNWNYGFALSIQDNGNFKLLAGWTSWTLTVGLSIICATQTIPASLRLISISTARYGIWHVKVNPSADSCVISSMFR